MLEIRKKYQRSHLDGFCENSDLMISSDGHIKRIDIKDLRVKLDFDFEDFAGFVEVNMEVLLAHNFDNLYLVRGGEVDLYMEDTRMISDLFDDVCLIIRNPSVLNGPTHLLKWETKEILWEGTAAIKAIRIPNAGLIYLCRKNISFPQVIKLIDVQTGKVQWSIDVSEIAKQERNGKVTDRQVIDYLGVHDGLLWFSLTDYKVIAVDPALGEIVHRVEGLPDQYKLQLDADNNLIIGMIDEKLWEVSTRSLQTKIYELDKEFASKKLKAVNFDYDMEHYYFIDHYQGYLGALDRETNKLKDLFGIEEVNPNDMRTMLSKIYYRRDRIMVTDIRGNLWIFSVMGKNRS